MGERIRSYGKRVGYTDAEVVIRGFGRGMGETIRAVTVNGEIMLSCSGYLLRKKAGSAGTS